MKETKQSKRHRQLIADSAQHAHVTGGLSPARNSMMRISARWLVRNGYEVDIDETIARAIADAT